MDSIQLYFYYFQWQTTPPQTHSSISSQHYSQHIVSLKPLLFQYLSFCSENTENVSLAEKSPMLFIIKKSFLRKYVEKHMQYGSPLQLALSFYFSLSGKCASTAGAQKAPLPSLKKSPASCATCKGQRQPSLSYPRSKKKCLQEECAPQQWAIFEDHKYRCNFLHYPRLFFPSSAKMCKEKRSFSLKL